MKIKTGSKNSKVGTPRVPKVTKPIPKKLEKTPKAEKIQTESIPKWIQESSEKKPLRKEWEESKLQWRKVTKKSQRSFSKNKERAYLEWKNPTNSLKKYPKTEKAPTGFSKAKNGWDKEKLVKPITRTWDIPGESPASKKEIWKKNSWAKKDEIQKKTPFIKPTWEKELPKIDKKKLKDPTKFFE